MVDIDTRTVSLRTSQLTWDIIDKRAEKLNLDRSKYTQRLYELEINHDLFNKPEKIKQITSKNKMRWTEIVSIMLLFVIFLLLVAAVLLG